MVTSINRDRLGYDPRAEDAMLGGNQQAIRSGTGSNGPVDRIPRRDEVNEENDRPPQNDRYDWIRLTKRDFNERHKKNCIASIISLVFLIFSIGLLLAGIFTGAFAALPLYGFIPMIVGGVVGIVASSFFLGVSNFGYGPLYKYENRAQWFRS